MPQTFSSLSPRLYLAMLKSRRHRRGKSKNSTRIRLLVATSRGASIVARGALILVLLTGLLLPRRVHAQLDETTKNRVARATVLVTALVVTYENGRAISEDSWPLGSGTVVSADGVILTNKHVITDALENVQEDVDAEQNAGVDQRVEPKLLIYAVDGIGDSPEPRFTAEIVTKADIAGLDLAALRITGNERGRSLHGSLGQAYLDQADSSTIETGDMLYFFGFPDLGFAAANNIDDTTIDAIHGEVRSIKTGLGLNSVEEIYVDAKIGRGSSGGAVVDEAGGLVGIATALREQGEAVVIPINRAVPLLMKVPGWSTPTPTPSEPTGELVVSINELNGSGMSGTATLTDNGDGTATVSIKVDGATSAHPVHIHSGTCANLGDVVFPLFDIDVNGSSETDIDVSLDDLMASPYAINVHESAANIGRYIACGDIIPNDQDSTGDIQKVDIKDFAFNPPSIEVTAGTTVTWTNNDQAPHTATQDGGGFQSDKIDPGASYSFTFDTPGTYEYHCEYHPGMHGTVVVE